MTADHTTATRRERPDLLALLFQHMPDDVLGPGWTCQVPGVLLQGAITEIQTLRDLIRRLAVDEPWQTSMEGLDDMCTFCGSYYDRAVTEPGKSTRWVNVHDHGCDWVHARRFLDLPLSDEHEEATEPLDLWWKRR